MATFALSMAGLVLLICDNPPVSDFVITDNLDRRRYELQVDDRIVSIADYDLVDDDIVVVPHVETDPELRGRGMADRLMQGILDDLRAHDRRIDPVCPYAAAYLRDHPDDQDLLA